MTNKDKALKMAIETFELINEHVFRCGITQYEIKACKEALAELQEHDNEVIERCAKVCDEQQLQPECPERASYCAEAIRALKSSDPKPRIYHEITDCV